MKSNVSECEDVLTAEGTNATVITDKQKPKGGHNELPRTASYTQESKR